MGFLDAIPEPWATRIAVLTTVCLGAAFYFWFPEIRGFGIGVMVGAVLTYVLRRAAGFSERKFWGQLVGKPKDETRDA